MKAPPVTQKKEEPPKPPIVEAKPTPNLEIEDKSDFDIVPRTTPARQRSGLYGYLLPIIHTNKIIGQVLRQAHQAF